MSVYIYLFKLLFLFCVFRNVCSNCVFQDGKYDLSSLDRSTPWPVSGTVVNGTQNHYEISLCRPLNYTSDLLKGCTKSSICQISSESAISFGNAIENISDYAIADNIDAGFSLYVLTKSLCKNKGIYRATINFACGPNLGAPELTLKADCQVNFFWRTSAACPVKPKNKQVPCYVLDEDGQKRDLSPLIKDTGGYNVINPYSDAEFVINVCSDVLINDPVINCPKNISACRISGNEFHSFGSVADGVQYTSEGLLLAYKTESSVFPSDCRLKPKTTILFKCPNRGFSELPKLISDLNCQYEVVWETEYACPESWLKGDLKTCQFTQKSHGVEIDLSPLRKVPVYNISMPSTSSYFLLSVCSGLRGTVTCNGQKWKHISACAFNSTGASQIAGTTDSAELVYADHDIILRYRKGSSCNGTEQMTAINFICDVNATNDGDGKPQYVSSLNDCNHVVEWHTKHACLKHSLDTPCSVTYKKKTVNLQKLLLTTGRPWVAVNHRSTPLSSNSEYFINVCGFVSNLGNYSKCGESSSACAINKEKGEYINLGNFTASPEYDHVSDSIILRYTGGSPCNGSKVWHSSIEFICRPGHINSEPVLVKIDESKCHYKFEWQTSEACPVGVIEGSNCRVYDNNLGVNYDLTPLRSDVYKIDSGEYEFYIGVCEPVKDSPCSLSSKKSQNVGVCQVSKSNKSSWKTGEPSSRLLYVDGVINLTYLSGDLYNDQNKTARMTVIIFMCDHFAGKGTPKFIEEADFTYIFHWYTDLVCSSSTSTECIVQDELSHDTYDLSELSMAKKNWMTFVNEDDKEKKLYINVCRSLAAPTVCDPNAAACLVEHTKTGEEKVTIPNLGYASSMPTLEGPGHLSLTYTNGDFCVAYGENRTYTTIIHFLCSDEKISRSGLQFLNKVGACEYSFLWSTKAACPMREIQSKASCELSDPDSGFTFDLSQLHRSKEPFTVELPTGNSFLLNICGKVEKGCAMADGSKQVKNVSVCEIDSNGKFVSNIAVLDNYNLSFSSGRDLTLTYRSANDNSKEVVVIKFPCYNSSEDSGLKFLHNEDGEYIFEMKTSLTCVPEHFDCNVIDQFGNEYDFGPLAKRNSGNWEVSDNRPGYSNYRYHINFCHPLNKASNYKCPGRLSSACQTSLADPMSMGHDLGSLLSEPLVSSKGTVVMRYTDGSFCQNGQFTRSTTINLFCTPEEGELKFIGETPECEYVFSLDTPYACPLQSSQGNNCEVKDPLFGYMFDLNPLKSKNNNYNVTLGEYSYAFNVCDKLNGFHNKCENSSACQLKPKDIGFSKSLGLPNDKPVYRKGLITLQYESGTGNCHGKYNRTTKITFTCHHAHEDKDGPVFISEAEDCTYLFEWPTVHACPPFDVIECSVVDRNGVYYDLSKLSLPNGNYYVKNPMSDQKTFVINICRSVVHTPDSLCPYTAAACLVDSSKSEPLNLGRVSQSPYIDNGKIKIKYTTGDPCDDGASSVHFKETVIEFICDPSILDSKPEFIGVDSCTYYFDWHTAYACAPSENVNTGDCTARDPFTGYIFNLTSLQKHGLYKIEFGNHEYSLSICGNSDTNTCGTNAGMCQEEVAGQKRHWVGGISNANLTYNNGVLYLNYSHGDACHNGQFERNTLIEFHCGHGIGEPQFLYESHDCTYFFTWKTELACQTLMHCAVKNGSLYFDLTSLAETYHTAASSVVNDNASYYISVCNTLDSIPGVSCPPGAAICRVSKDPKTSWTVAESLGKVEYPPFVDFMGHATVLYTNGSSCEKSPELKNRARIIFLCDTKAGVGEPVLLERSADCFFLFEWRTSVVCPEKPEVPSTFTSCKYIDNSRGLNFDLLPLQKTGTKAYYEVFEGQSMSFKLNICANLSGPNVTECGDAGICGQSGNIVYHYGVAASQKFTYDGRRLRLTFYGGDDCPSGLNGKRTSEIFFVCDPNAGMGEPVLHKRYTCLAVFMWKTALVCLNTPQKCAFDIDGQHYDINLLSSLTHNWIVEAENKTFWINLCQGVQPTADTLGCPPTSAVCMRDKDGYHMSLGMVQSMQVKSMNSTDLLLLFNTGDSKACQSIHSDPPMHAVTRLFMRCGTTLGEPKLTSGPDDKCFYNFVWESSLACADKAEVVVMEKDGIIQDQRLNFSFDINDILNKTYTVFSNSTNDYVYKINLSGGVAQNSSDPTSTCAKAAVCQTKPKTDVYFQRDIGSFATRTFIVRGSELHLIFKSLTRGCGKNPTKEVTTLIKMQCMSAVGKNSPEFLYESGNCDYVFEWPTVVVCPSYHRKKHDENEPSTNAYTEIVSHKGQIVGGIIFAFIAALIIVFVVYKPERRAFISSKFRTLFGRVNLPYFRYKRCDGERLVLVDASQTVYDDEEMLRC